MQNVSTGDAVVDIVDFLYDCFDAGETALGVFLDLSKAFDTLNREILFAKLRYYGVGENVLAWFRSYFSERQQCVRCKGIISDLKTTEYGVAQGSVLGPILYVIYMNDIINCSNILNFAMYADDTCVYLCNSNLITNVNSMNNELVKVVEWV